jgi:hypothetical protein
MRNERGLTMKRGMQATLSGVLALAALALCAGPGFAQTTNASGSNSTANSGSNSTSGARSNQNQGQSVTYIQTTPADQTIKNVPNVYGPGLTAAGSEVCLGSVSAGGAGAGFGVTIGGTIVDQECQLRMNARTLATLGYAKAAREEMCVDPQVRAAMAAAGTPCVADESAKPQATAEYEGPAPAAVPQTSARGCHKGYELLGGWYDVCPPGAQTADAALPAPAPQAVAQVSPDQISQDLAPPTATGCTKKYQLIGGWYDDCK